MSVTRAINETEVRSNFPSLARTTESGIPVAYLDGPGGTQVPASVIAAISEYLTSSNSNIEGEYELTRMTDALIERAREQAGDFVGGDSECVVFGQNMTTLNFLLTSAFGRTLEAGDEIVVTQLDHDGNVAPWLMLAHDRGLVVRTVKLRDDLSIDLDDLASQLNDRTKVVAFTLASNATGTLTPAAEIVRMAHEAGAIAWVDAVAYAAHRRLDVTALDCDVLLCSPYKFFGPHLGLAWIRRELAESWTPNRVRPAGSFPVGHRFETGTLSHEAIAGFSAAIDYLASLGTGTTLTERLDSSYQAIARHETGLAEHFIRRIAEVPGLRLVGHPTADTDARVGTFGLVVEGGGSAERARALGDRGIYTWNGSFYAQGVMEHLGIDLEEGLLRVGVVHYNTTAEIDRLIDELSAI